MKANYRPLKAIGIEFDNMQENPSYNFNDLVSSFSFAVFRFISIP